MKVLDSRKFLFVGVLLLISTLVVNGASSKGTPFVKDVSFKTNGETLEVKITATHDARYTYFELKSPHRLVVDFHGIQSDIGFKEKQVGAAGVSRVRTSFYNTKNRQATRLVFDLYEGVPYQVVKDGEGVVRVVFGLAAAATVADAGSAPMNLTAGPPTFIPEKTPAGIAASLPTVKLGSALFQGELEAPGQPALLAVQTPVPQTPNPQTAAAQTAPVQPTPRPTPTTNIIISPPIQGPTPLANPIPVSQYQGEVYSFEFKDNFPMRDFFHLIGEVSGLNIVLDPNVTGNISMTLRDVPWDQALDIVLKTYGLTGQLQGNVLRIATNATIAAEEATRASIRTAQENALPLETRTYILNYTTAALAAPTLQRVLSPRGTIVQEPRRNALIVSDIPAQFNRVEEIKNFIDTPAQQVEIEARLVSANKSFSRDIGIQLGFLFGANSGNVLTGVPTNPSPVARTPAPRVTSGTGIPLAVDLPAPATSGLGFFIQPGGDVILDAIISAAEAKGTAKFISRPKVVTQNNQPANVSQGTQIPVQTNVNNTVSVQFLEFNLQLTVTPQITDAGTILLNVAVENSQPDFARAVNGIPSVSTQRAQTLVLVPDGGTAVIGGILVDNDSVNIRQVPGLGSLPIIGHLFKNTSTLKSTAELLFFITPRVQALDAIRPLMPLPPPPPPGGR